MSSPITFLVLLISFSCQFYLASTEQLKIKILEETPSNSYDLNQFLNNRNSASGGSASRQGFLKSYNGVTGQEGSLVAKYKPAPLNGPYHLVNDLVGKCLEHTENNYKWVICPFDNVTQYEQNIRWRPYQGVLGVWYEWIIANDKFDSMLMSNGDSCGNQLGYRQTTLKFKCNEADNKTNVASVSEPSMCLYEVLINSPLVCENKTSAHNIPWSNMMYVYPYLNENLKSEWDSVYHQYKQGILTEKMYNMSQEMIFQNAGFKRKETDLKTILAKVDEETSDDKNEDKSESSNKDADSKLAEKLQKCEKENQDLKDLLRQHGINYTLAAQSPNSQATGIKETTKVSSSNSPA